MVAAISEAKLSHGTHTSPLDDEDQKATNDLASRCHVCEEQKFSYPVVKESFRPFILPW
jgi:hypothetical protein